MSTPPGAYRIRCAEVWGGIRNANLDVCTSGVTASLYSASSDGEQGGDIYYFAVCDSDLLTRVVIADLAGHGEPVSLLSQLIYDVLRESMNTLESAPMLNRLNAAACDQGFHALTTAAVVSFYLGDSRLYLSVAGHPPVLLRRQGESHWQSLPLTSTREPSNLPLGVFPDTHYDQESLPLERGDRLLLYTDGVLECANSRDEQFGQARLFKVLAEDRGHSLAEIKTNVLTALTEHAGDAVREDDVTILAIEIS